MNSRTAARRMPTREAHWCFLANRWGHRTSVRGFFAAVSRLGDGVFWYVLMALIVLVTLGTIFGSF